MKILAKLIVAFRLGKFLRTTLPVDALVADSETERYLSVYKTNRRATPFGEEDPETDDGLLVHFG